MNPGFLCPPIEPSPNGAQARSTHPFRPGHTSNGEHEPVVSSKRPYLFKNSRNHLDPQSDIPPTSPDLTLPPVTQGKPAVGQRVQQTQPNYQDTEVHHLLYLPTDWKEGASYPVIVEYAGNKWQTSLGTVEGSKLGYGISEGTGAIWLCLPFVNPKKGINATNWWGDPDATVAYCKQAVRDVCENYGGDPERLVLAGFSRGAIACNFIGLHDDEIAALWCGFICHSHYDGVKEWPYSGSDRQSAAKRLARLGRRPQFISHERSIDTTKAYLKEAYPTGAFTFLSTSFAEHTDSWVLRDIPERKVLRTWFAKLTDRNTP